MSVTITLHCGGCDAVASGQHPIRTGFISLNGQDHGIGGMDSKRLLKSLLTSAPEGWVMFDPYTYATYCPKCWSSIEEEEDDHGR